MTTWASTSQVTTTWDIGDEDAYIDSGYVLDGYIYGTGNTILWTQQSASSTVWS